MTQPKKLIEVAMPYRLNVCETIGFSMAKFLIVGWLSVWV